VARAHAVGAASIRKPGGIDRILTRSVSSCASLLKTDHLPEVPMPSDEATIADGWTCSGVTGALSGSVGQWGHRMRLFQKRAGGPFYSIVNLTDGRRQVRSLGTADPAAAFRLTLGRLDPSGDTGISACRVALGPLWERYRTECETFRTQVGCTSWTRPRTRRS
jgi:hypothetical protein